MNITKDKIKELYYSGGTKLVAKYCNCSIPTALKAIKESGIAIKKEKT